MDFVVDGIVLHCKKCGFQATKLIEPTRVVFIPIFHSNEMYLQQGLNEKYKTEGKYHIDDRLICDSCYQKVKPDEYTKKRWEAILHLDSIKSDLQEIRWTYNNILDDYLKNMLNQWVANYSFKRRESDLFQRIITDPHIHMKDRIKNIIDPHMRHADERYKKIAADELLGASSVHIAAINSIMEEYQRKCAPKLDEAMRHYQAMDKSKFSIWLEFTEFRFDLSVERYSLRELKFYRQEVGEVTELCPPIYSFNIDDEFASTFDSIEVIDLLRKKLHDEILGELHNMFVDEIVFHCPKCGCQTTKLIEPPKYIIGESDALLKLNEKYKTKGKYHIEKFICGSCAQKVKSNENNTAHWEEILRLQSIRNDLLAIHDEYYKDLRGYLKNTINQWIADYSFKEREPELLQKIITDPHVHMKGRIKNMIAPYLRQRNNAPARYEKIAAQELLSASSAHNAALAAITDKYQKTYTPKLDEGKQAMDKSEFRMWVEFALTPFPLLEQVTENNFCDYSEVNLKEVCPQATLLHIEIEFKRVFRDAGIFELLREKLYAEINGELQNLKS